MSDAIPEHLARLLASSIESADRLDILMHLRANRGKTFSARSIAMLLRVSSVASEQHLALLCGRGFLTVSIGTDLLYSYQPVSAAIDIALQEIADLLVTRRADVLAAVKDRTKQDPAHVFANAFLIRKKGRRDG